MIVLTIYDRLRPYLSKWIGGLVSAGLVIIVDKTGIVALSDQAVSTAITSSIMWVLGSTVHTLTSKKTNPSNTASAHLAKLGATEVKEIKNLNGVS